MHCAQHSGARRVPGGGGKQALGSHAPAKRRGGQEGGAAAHRQAGRQAGKSAGGQAGRKGGGQAAHREAEAVHVAAGVHVVQPIELREQHRGRGAGLGSLLQALVEVVVVARECACARNSFWGEGGGGGQCNAALAVGNRRRGAGRWRSDGGLRRKTGENGNGTKGRTTTSKERKKSRSKRGSVTLACDPGFVGVGVGGVGVGGGGASASQQLRQCQAPTHTHTQTHACARAWCATTWTPGRIALTACAATAACKGGEGIASPIQCHAACLAGSPRVRPLHRALSPPAPEQWGGGTRVSPFVPPRRPDAHL